MEHWDRIDICRRADGSAWVLGEGRFGKVQPPLPSNHFCCQLIHTLVSAAMDAGRPTCWGDLQDFPLAADKSFC